ncbi:phosphatase domain-containing protein [Aurantiacibacter spongiae]|uniref:DUF2183 domain-containing protein n=1 Tax=Aurantiacibacter spongiae TaxID=2488860 RepID=A0A3N5DIL7_9SPHN|nr:phosphatase domain-containing protein [Aurantiacibacter spongiae]RPF71492.1 DUF2183 domain-containing protein [Aurantiacibacter spongiae]
MPFIPRHPVRIQPLLGHRSRDRLILSARALRSRSADFGKVSRLGAISRMARHFISHEIAGLSVRLEIAGPNGLLLREERITDKEGYVLFDVTFSRPWDLPDRPVWETASLHWTGTARPQRVDAHILAPGSDSRIAVISDIDDTIIETGLTGGLRGFARNWDRVFAQMPGDRVAVPGADAFFGQLSGGVLEPGEKRARECIPATRRPFFYVSSSPWNLFSYLVAFQRAKGLPLGPLKLRDWGLNRETFGSNSHGAHKDAAIDEVLGMYPAMRFALIGDDTQGDLPAFAGAVERFPGRIAAVFLRKVSESEFSPAEVAAQAAIEAAGVPLWLGETYVEGRDFLDTVGFTPGGETEQIVKAVEKVDTGAEPIAGDPGGP